MASNNNNGPVNTHFDWISAVLFLLAAPFILLAVPFIGMAAMLLTALQKLSGTKSNPSDAWKTGAMIGIPIAALLFIAALTGSKGSTPSQSSSPPTSRRSISDVWVNSYVKDDGTYVPGHYRSQADGNAENNWSSRGNINPYTGEEGTKDPHSASMRQRNHASPDWTSGRVASTSTQNGPSPSEASGEPSLSDDSNLTYEEESRRRSAERLKSYGVEFDWKRTSFSDLLDIESRVRWCEELRKLGVHVDWQEHTLSALIDMESRVRWSEDLRKLGVDVKWQDHTLSALIDMESRVRWANSLKKLSVTVDWRQHSLSTLIDMESRVRWSNGLREQGVEVDWKVQSLSSLIDMDSRVRWANGLKRFGIVVDWREHSLSDLIELERRARAKQSP